MRSVVILIWLLELAALAAGIISYRQHSTELVAFILGLAAGAVSLGLPMLLFYKGFRLPGVQKARDTEINESSFFDHSEVDPWEAEQALLTIRAQPAPERPMLTKEGLVGYSRVLVSAAALGQAIVSTISRHTIEVSRDLHPALIHLDRTIAQVVRVINLAEVHLRQLTGTNGEGLGDWPGCPLELDRATMLLEESVDLVGSAAAFSLLAGLPGAEGYRAMVVSQLSKADPKTGRIARDGSGRSIRGPNYQPAELDKLLIDHFPFLQSELSEQPIIPSSVH